LSIARGSLAVRRHEELFQWLDEDVQQFLPHAILLAAWGDFSIAQIRLDVISRLPGLRTTEINNQVVLPLLTKLFERWDRCGHAPFIVTFRESYADLGITTHEPDLGNAAPCFAIDRSAVVHGIKDARGNLDCLYVAISDPTHDFDEPASRWMELLTPYIDAALRRVAHLPTQYSDQPDPIPEAEPPQPYQFPKDGVDTNPFELSPREIEIMHWLKLGKTNIEIGMILDISSLTVKNHLQRTFRKLEVLNRTQAVAKFYKGARSPFDRRRE